MAEFSTDKEKKDAAEKALVAYKDATDLAKGLDATHAIRPVSYTHLTLPTIYSV